MAYAATTTLQQQEKIYTCQLQHMACSMRYHIYAAGLEHATYTLHDETISRIIYRDIPCLVVYWHLCSLYVGDCDSDGKVLVICKFLLQCKCHILYFYCMVTPPVFIIK